ncbi:hypothetical protein [Streptomyces sp. NPDC051677]|uniref:hypothetical protein n=1 Tax=Streptomyces sp. NPDC051677 TaxID=3365669 RepID=UPI0037D5E637
MGKPFDSFDNAAVALLTDMPLWRLRAIERIELSSAFWSERHREIHVRSLKEVLHEDSDRAEWMRGRLSEMTSLTLDGSNEIELILPVTEMPKIPLLDLRITVAGKQVHRLSKDESARIAAKYVIQLARGADLMPTNHEPVHLIDFLTFLFYHPSEPYERIVRKYDLIGYHDRTGYPEFLPQREYLQSKELDIPFNVERPFPSWKHEAEEINKVARHYVIADYLSGTEHPIIGIPYFIEELKRRRDRFRQHADVRQPEMQDVSNLLAYIRTAVVEAYNNGKPTPEAHRFLIAYFAYGYRWMTFVRCRVPFNKSFAITVEDRRAIYFRPERDLDRHGSMARLFKQHSWHMVAFADAETNHVSIRVSDPSVLLKTSNGWPRVSDENKRDITEDRVDEEERTFELYLRQDSTECRRERFYIEAPLRLTRIQSWMLNLTILITLFAFCLLVRRITADAPDFVKDKFVVPSHGLTAKDLSVILVPVAFAAAFLLIRDTSTLSMRIRQVRQTILMVALFALLAAAFFLMWTHYIKIG